MVAEEVVVTLSGGAPWGFRLQGGSDQKQPLQVSKVRKRSKACRAGLREADELVSINDVFCGELSHAEAMNLIDGGRGTLHLRIKRAQSGFSSVVLLDRAPSPRIDKEYRAALRALSPPVSSKVSSTHRGSLMSPTNGPECLRSPPDSEAYYGETDSDADVAAQDRHRRPKRRSPSSSPARILGRISPCQDDISEMSGCESTSDMSSYSQIQSWAIPNGTHKSLPGVARREVVYQPNGVEWALQGEQFSENSDQSPSGGVEVDSGFQELPSVPLVSPIRAKEALMRASYSQLVPMVGPVDNPVDEKLTMTYMDKAKEAKLHRSEGVQDKQVKEARSKCRTIASLLTDAPNPHSKGVLMFKKRRQRAKKYTLTSFGSADTESCSNTDGETEDESIFLGSESEIDEDSLSAAPDPTWDSGYLDVLEKRTSAYGLSDGEAEVSLGLSETSGRGAQLFDQQRKKAEEHIPTPITPTLNSMPQQQPDPMLTYTSVTPINTISSHNTSMMNGEPVVVSRTSVVLSPPGQTSMPTTSDACSGSSVTNRTARPFAAGCISHRAATAPVIFKPNTIKKSPLQAQAVSVATVPASFSPVSSDGKRAIASSSLYIPPRPSTVPTSSLSPSSSVASAPFPLSSLNATPVKPQSSGIPAYQSSPAASTPPVNSPPAMGSPSFPSIPTQNMCFSSPPVMAQTQPQSAQSYLSTYTPSSSQVPAPAPVEVPAPGYQGPNVQPPPSPHKVSFNPYITVATTTSGASESPIVHQYPLSNPSTGISSREQRISVPASRTGILQEARRRGTKKPMFSKVEEKKPVSYNPELLSLVQNLDDRSHSGTEPGFESGPEEDYLNLGAEACNFMPAHRSKIPPAIAPKPRNSTIDIPQMGGKGADLFARRQSRMDRYVVDKQPKSPANPREPSPTPSLPAHWKYSSNVRAPPPISYNPLLSPSCPPVAQRGSRGNEATRSGIKSNPSQNKQGIKALDFLSKQPYQLNSSLFSYGGGVPQTVSTYHQHQQQPSMSNGVELVGTTLNSPKQVPVKAPRVYEIKRFSTPTPMSAPTALNPTVIVPRSATTLAEPMWRSYIDSPPPITQQSATPFSPPPAPFSPPPPVPTGALPALPTRFTASVPNAMPMPGPVPMQASAHFQGAKQFKSAPNLSPLSPSGMHSAVSASSQNLQAPRPRFSTSTMGLQPKVWRPGSIY
ncbi:Synaptopodin 2-like protein [Bagarius yarrelli]|uniref:Synaptopodin 2-like protein n=1 Tax=Bagarius yarrelli TaxID=175774 RepID=A0A556V8G5_BAGYA|nr:Synaptopodin 2-like protein [Bagarius yarrelli]